MSRTGGALWGVLTIIIGLVMYIGMSNKSVETVYFSAIFLGVITGIFIGIELAYTIKPFHKKDSIYKQKNSSN